MDRYDESSMILCGKNEFLDTRRLNVVNTTQHETESNRKKSSENIPDTNEQPASHIAVRPGKDELNEHA